MSLLFVDGTYLCSTVLQSVKVPVKNFRGLKVSIFIATQKIFLIYLLGDTKELLFKGFLSKQSTQKGKSRPDLIGNLVLKSELQP